MSTTVYVNIGNSDDKLTQFSWHLFVDDTRQALMSGTNHIHGEWFSESSSPWQNACWCVEFKDDESLNKAKLDMGRLAYRYGQNSVAWAPTPGIEFVGPVRE